MINTTMPAINTKEGLKHRLWFAYIVFLIGWSFCIYNWVGQQIHKHELFARVIDGRPYVADFVNFYDSALLAADCSKGNVDIYSVKLQDEYQKRMTAPVVAETPFYHQYPPMFFSIVLPLAYFDLLGAYIVWVALGAVLLVLSTIYLIRTARDEPPAKQLANQRSGKGKFTIAFMIAAALASFPTWNSIEIGQTSLMLVPGLVAFWICCLKRKYFLAGLASFVVMMKLQYLPPVFLIGCLLGRGAYLGGFVTIGVVLLLHAIYVLGMDNITRFPHALISGELSQGTSGVAADQMQNLRGNLTLLLGGDTTAVHIIMIAGFGLAMAILLYLWWQAGKTWWHQSAAKQKETKPAAESSTLPLEAAGQASSTERDEQTGENENQAGTLFRILASISSLIMLAVSPHCHIQDYLALITPCVWLWLEAAKLKEAGYTGRGLTALQAMILLFPVLGWPFFVFKFLFQIAKIQPFFLWNVIVLVLSCRLYADLNRKYRAKSAGS